MKKKESKEKDAEQRVEGGTTAKVGAKRRLEGGSATATAAEERIAERREMLCGVFFFLMVK